MLHTLYCCSLDANVCCRAHARPPVRLEATGPVAPPHGLKKACCAGHRSTSSPSRPRADLHQLFQNPLASEHKGLLLNTSFGCKHLVPLMCASIDYCNRRCCWPGTVDRSARTGRMRSCLRRSEAGASYRLLAAVSSKSLFKVSSLYSFHFISFLFLSDFSSLLLETSSKPLENLFDIFLTSFSFVHGFTASGWLGPGRWTSPGPGQSTRHKLFQRAPAWADRYEGSPRATWGLKGFRADSLLLFSLL